jgi:hypothetical protein
MSIHRIILGALLAAFGCASTGGAHPDPDAQAPASPDAPSAAPGDGAPEAAPSDLPGDLSSGDTADGPAGDLPPPQPDTAGPDGASVGDAAADVSTDLSREQTQCAGLARMSLEHVAWNPAASAPGDAALLTIDLINRGDMAAHYPGVVLAVDHPGVTFTPTGGSFNRFVIPAGGQAPHTWRVTFGPAVPPATAIGFHARAASLNQPPCPEAAALDFFVTLMPR